MNTENFTMNTLFAQLGLDNTDSAIQYFIGIYAPLSEQVVLHKAKFWNSSQAAFLQQAIADDSEWSYLVDHLDSLMR
jgi:hypothetical protein